MHHRTHALAAALAVGLPLLAALPARADPADPRAPAPPLRHRSAFADYVPYQDPAPGDWRRLNDTVGAAALKPPPAPASAPARAMPVPGMPHHHHQHHQGGGRP